LEDPAVDGRMIQKWISRSGMGGMDWIELAQDMTGGGFMECSKELWGSHKM